MWDWGQKTSLPKISWLWILKFLGYIEITNHVGIIKIRFPKLYKILISKNITVLKY